MFFINLFLGVLDVEFLFFDEIFVIKNVIDEVMWVVWDLCEKGYVIIDFLDLYFNEWVNWIKVRFFV